MLSFRRRNAPLTVTQSDTLPEFLTAAEAASLLGISVARFRALAGTRDAPTPELGQPLVVPGTRGGRWSSDRALQLAMSSNSPRLKVALPPLLPTADGTPRYERVSKCGGHPLEHHVHLESEQDSVETSAWAELYLPTMTTRCGHSEPCLIVLTPLGGTRLTLTSVVPLTEAALALPSWHQLRFEMSDNLIVAVLPIGDGTGVADPIDTYAFRRRPLEDIAQGPLEGDVGQDTVRPSRLEACTGDPVPWWPAGTASAGACAAWSLRLGPVRLEAPDAVQPRLEAARWLVAEGFPDAEDPVLHASATMLARALTPEPWEWSQLIEPAPRGFTLAVTLAAPGPDTIAPAPDLRVGFDLALNRVLDMPDVPPAIGKTLLGEFGDPTRTRPVAVSLDALPADWIQLLREQAVPCPPTSTPRSRALSDCVQVGAGETHDPAGWCAWGDVKGYLDANVLAWCAPTYSDPTRAADPPLTLPHDIETALLIRTGDGGQVYGWARRRDGKLIALPAKSQWDTGFGGQARTLAAAIQERTLASCYGGNPDPELESLVTYLDQQFRSLRPRQARSYAWSLIANPPGAPRPPHVETSPASSRPPLISEDARRVWEAHKATFREGELEFLTTIPEDPEKNGYRATSLRLLCALTGLSQDVIEQLLEEENPPCQTMQ